MKRAVRPPMNFTFFLDCQDILDVEKGIYTSTGALHPSMRKCKTLLKWVLYVLCTVHIGMHSEVGGAG